MTATENNKILAGYLKLLSGLTEENKLKLIKKLEKKENIIKEQDLFLQSFGSWVGDETADELIEDIRKSRFDNQIREEL